MLEEQACRLSPLHQLNGTLSGLHGFSFRIGNVLQLMIKWRSENEPAHINNGPTQDSVGLTHLLTASLFSAEQMSE